MNLQKFIPQLSEGSIVSKEREGRAITDQIFKLIAGSSSDPPVPTGPFWVVSSAAWSSRST
jgi:hypothetical protein